MAHIKMLRDKIKRKNFHSFSNLLLWHITMNKFRAMRYRSIKRVSLIENNNYKLA